MPSLGSGLSLGTISRISGYDFDASAFITANSISDSFSVPIYGRNLIGYSNEFRFSATGGTWRGSASGELVTIGARNIADPFGTNTASEIIQNPVSYGRVLRGNYSTGGVADPWLVNSTKYVLSFYAKKGTYDYAGARIGGKGSSSTDTYVTYNLNNGTATTITPLAGTIHSASATSVGNGWYRCVLVYTTPASSQNANFIDIAMPTSTGGSGDVGDSTKYIYLCAVQLEQGDSPTTYSPVSGSSFSNLSTDNITSYEIINPKSLINKFVKGVKDLGLWSNLVCWPLRSFQNSSGSTLSSLGGYGLYNATKVNSPTTNVDGMYGTNTNQTLTHSAIPFGTGAFSFYTASKVLALSSYRGIAGGFDFTQSASFGSYMLGFYQTGSYDIKMDFELEATTGGTSSRVFTQPPYVIQNRFYPLAYTKSGQTLKAYVDNSLLGQSSSLTAGVSMTRTGNATLMNRVTANGTNNTLTMAFSAYFHGVELTSTQLQDFHNLYKSTLGYGLSYL